MQIESIILVSNYSDDTKPNQFVYSTKQKGAGYQHNNSGIHTVVYSFDEFKGAVKIQGTLSLYPGESDWFDIPYSILGGDSTIITGSYYTVIGEDSSIIPSPLIVGDSSISTGTYAGIVGGDSSVISNSTITCSIVGKFVWVRAAYLLEQGTIVQVRYNV